MYKYGLVGNCQLSALSSSDGSIDWLCLPRPDSEPVFGHLLDPHGGAFSISFADENEVFYRQQYYLQNTNVLVTDLRDTSGASFRITDFSPRYENHGRIYRPNVLFRIVEPLQGNPVIRASCLPIAGWSKEAVRPTVGSGELIWDIRDSVLQLVTNMPITHLYERTAFPLEEKLYFGLSWGTIIEENIGILAETSLERTVHYWRTWVKHCSIPSAFQKETIRSALALKLHCYEDTGAILAAITTSLPEEIGKPRNWDYRFCWPRDAYFVLSALHNLGHFEEMEGFLKFLLNIAQMEERSLSDLRPVYTLNRDTPLPEIAHLNWAGFARSQPVRTFNQAADHIQNDVYGEMVLTLAPIFLDERFYSLRTAEHQSLLSRLGDCCIRSIDEVDAGPWELRKQRQVHSFTNLMCWAGLERLERIRALGFLSHWSADVRKEKIRAETAIQRAVVEGSLRNGPEDPSYDAALSQLAILNYPDRKLSENTVDAILRNLNFLDTDGRPSGFFYRYLRADDFGKPNSGFAACSFWIAQALARLNSHDLAAEILHKAVTSANPIGLLSEHFNPNTHQQLGNFPQAYSHVGLINAAFAVSPPWSDVL